MNFGLTLRSITEQYPLLTEAQLKDQYKLAKGSAQSIWSNKDKWVLVKDENGVDFFQCLSCTVKWDNKLLLYQKKYPHRHSHNISLFKIKSEGARWGRMLEHNESNFCKINEIPVIHIPDDNSASNSDNLSPLETIIILTIAEMKGHISADLHKLLMQYTLITNPAMSDVKQLWSVQSNLKMRHLIGS